MRFLSKWILPVCLSILVEIASMWITWESLDLGSDHDITISQSTEKGDNYEVEYRTRIFVWFPNMQVDTVTMAKIRDEKWGATNDIHFSCPFLLMIHSFVGTGAVPLLILWHLWLRSQKKNQTETPTSSA
jgi:hypothetical protein